MTGLAVSKSNQHWGAAVWALLALWFAFAVWASLSGLFDRGNGPPIALGIAVVGPIILFELLNQWWPAFHQFVLSGNLRVLTLLQTWRVGGITFLILYWKGMLPGQFALPAGLGDMTVGITAPFIAWYIGRQQQFPKSLFIGWTAFGIADLIVAVTMGVLSSPSPAGLLAGTVATRLMGQFPLSLVPTFFVPLLMILHIISLRALTVSMPREN
jgi:hypothetical protein